MRRTTRVAIVFLVMLMGAGVRTILAQDAAREVLEGVMEIGAPGTPGSVLVWGPSAETLVCGGKAGRREGVVAAAGLGKGRIVAFGHTGYGDEANLRVGDTGRLMVNSVRWAGGGRDLAKGTVGVMGGNLTATLQGAGIASEVVTKESLVAALKRVRVLVLFREDLGDGEIDAVRRFVEDGGGLVTAQTGWGWRQIHKGRDLRENAINRIMAPAGIAFGDGTPDTVKDGRYTVSAGANVLLNAAGALDALKGSELGEPGARKLSKDDLAQAEMTLSAVARALPRDDAILRPHLAKLMTGGGGSREPSAVQPLTRKDSLARVLLSLRVEELFAGPLDSCAAHPAAADFPGAVPEGAERVTRTVSIDTRVPEWHSLGLYAAPGEAVTVRVSEEAAKAGLELQIGSHTDQLWHHDSWKRVPRVVRRTALHGRTTVLASPFGGLVYIDVPGKCGLGAIQVEVSGAVESPLYVRGKTGAAEWREKVRGAPGPWAELASDKVIVTVPSSLVRELDDPEAVMEVWDRVLDAAADLATMPRERARPERYVADVQISAGYMHSGYPIMTHLDAAESMASAEKLRKGNWGLFHELGHNHQRGEWTFEGTGEVTCNLFSLYIMETVCGRTPAEAHDANDKTSERIAKYFAEPASLARWHADPFTALVMYRQMREAFGWEAYKKVFAEYRELKPDERPRSDQEKRDEWMVRMSRATGRNLGPFFERWGVTTTEGARESVKGLEAWMAEGMGN